MTFFKHFLSLSKLSVRQILYDILIYQIYKWATVQKLPEFGSESHSILCEALLEKISEDAFVVFPDKAYFYSNSYRPGAHYLCYKNKTKSKPKLTLNLFLLVV